MTLTTLVIFYLLTSAVGSILGGAFSTLGSVAGSVGRAAGGSMQTVAQTAAPSLATITDPMGRLEQTMRNASGGNDPAAAKDAAVSAMRALLTGDQAQAANARDRAAEAWSKAQSIPLDQAKTQVAEYERQFRQAVDKAKRQATVAADETARAVSRGALLGFVALLLCGVAAWFGGRMGAVRSAFHSDPQAVRYPRQG